MTTSDPKSRMPIDWPLVSIVSLFGVFIIALMVGLFYDARFARNYAVGCTKAGGTFVSLDGKYNCVTITPVAAEVVR